MSLAQLSLSLAQLSPSLFHLILCCTGQLPFGNICTFLSFSYFQHCLFSLSHCRTSASKITFLDPKLQWTFCVYEARFRRSKHFFRHPCHPCHLYVIGVMCYLSLVSNDIYGKIFHMTDDILT